MKATHDGEQSSPADKLDRAFRTVLAVSKADLLKEEARLKAMRDKQREAKKQA